MNTQKQIFLIITLTFAIAGSCAAYTMIDLPVRAERQSDFFMDESIERGALLFANNCRTCHGIRGEGGVGLALNKASFQDQDPLVLAANQSMIRRTLICGRAGTLMPAWLNSNGGALTANQIEHLVRLLTAPVDEETPNELGRPSNEGWNASVEFAHNLNRHTAVSIAGETLGVIAKTYEIGPEALAQENSIAIDTMLEKNTVLRLPIDGRSVKILPGETVAKVAERWHVGAMVIADLNNIEFTLSEDGFFSLPYNGENTDMILDLEATPATTGLIPGEELKLPDGTMHTIQGGNIETTASEYGNVTAATLAAKNNLTPETILPVGKALELPDDSWGTIPGDAVNSGIACIQDALPPSVFDTLPGLGEPLPPIEDPGFVSSEVEILAYETSWVIVADGVELEPNRGGVRVKINTEIPIVGMVGLHTVTLNGEKEGDDFDAGITRTISFGTPGAYELTCDYHLTMQAKIWVE